MLDLFPESAVVEGGELALGGLGTGELAGEFGTPLFVYCEATLRAQARAYLGAAPEALVAYGSKAFPNLALLRLFAGEGLGEWFSRAHRTRHFVRRPVLLAAGNAVGGYVVTERMLEMFKSSGTRVAKPKGAH